MLKNSQKFLECPTVQYLFFNAARPAYLTALYRNFPNRSRGFREFNKNSHTEKREWLSRQSARLLLYLFNRKLLCTVEK